MGFWASKVLLSAVEPGIFSVLNDGLLLLRALRSRTGLHHRSAHDFSMLRQLSCMHQRSVSKQRRSHD